MRAGGTWGGGGGGVEVDRRRRGERGFCGRRKCSFDKGCKVSDITAAPDSPKGSLGFVVCNCFDYSICLFPVKGLVYGMKLT